MIMQFFSKKLRTRKKLERIMRNANPLNKHAREVKIQTFKQLMLLKDDIPLSVFSQQKAMKTFSVGYETSVVNILDFLWFWIEAVNSNKPVYDSKPYPSANTPYKRNILDDVLVDVEGNGISVEYLFSEIEKIQIAIEIPLGKLILAKDYTRTYWLNIINTPLDELIKVIHVIYLASLED